MSRRGLVTEVFRDPAFKHEGPIYEPYDWSTRAELDIRSSINSPIGTPQRAKVPSCAAVERARKAHRGEDMDEVKAALEELTGAFQAAG